MSNLVSALIQLSNLPTDHSSLVKIMNRKRERRGTINRNAITSQTPSQSIPGSPRHAGTSGNAPVMNGGMGSSDAKTVGVVSNMGVTSPTDRDASALNGSAVTEPSMEGSRPAQDAEPGTLKASLAATPGLFIFYRISVGNSS